ncbi:MAG: hypothetical protein IJ631_05680 [Schwartzia sp.]|nr:hypothetical protein [Schwartzia sp. (in: firmicutes)]
MMTLTEKIKEGARLLQRQAASALRDDQVTLRGELLVTRPGMADVSEEEVRGTGVLAALAPLRSVLPGTKITAERSMLSVDVRFFCYEAAPDSPDFQAELCRTLENAIARIEQAGFEARLNARGEWKRLDRVETFCCMNKGHEVSCKAVNEAERTFAFKNVRESASNALDGL